VHSTAPSLFRPLLFFGSFPDFARLFAAFASRGPPPLYRDLQARLRGDRILAKRTSTWLAKDVIITMPY
jgi:hypothetical protein